MKMAAAVISCCDDTTEFSRMEKSSPVIKPYCQEAKWHTESLQRKKHLLKIENQLQERNKREQFKSKSTMSVPELPAILAYLRWLDRMESWNGRNFPAKLSQLAQRKIDKELYSWGTEFGNPIELPQIKKYFKAEKYRSDQLKTSLQIKNKDIQPNTKMTGEDIQRTTQKNNLETIQKPLADFYRPNVWFPKPDKVIVKTKSKSAPGYLGVRNNGKPTPFYVHAKQGFKYWPNDLRKKSEHPTKYSFGEKYNPGRAGVITDRIYAKPRTNYHYWAEYEQHQKPISSRNFSAKKHAKK